MAKLRKPKRKSDNSRFEKAMDRMAAFKSLEWGVPYLAVREEMRNDDTYDYEALYNDRPFLFATAENGGHFSDYGKTAKHPTFSNESKYSGKLHPTYNPTAIEGGSWVDDHSFRPSLQLVQSGFDMQRSLSYMRQDDPKARIVSPKYKTGKSSGMIRMPNKKWKYAE